MAVTPLHRPLRVAIIGGGVGGLAAAIHLASAGCCVTLFEKNDQIGGKLNRRVLVHPDQPGEAFTFDTGPSLLTMPWVFEQLFRVGGTELRERLELVRLDPISRFVWPDGEMLEFRQNRDDTLDSVRQLAPKDVDGFRRFLDRGKDIWERAGELFLTQSPEQIMAAKRSPRDGLAMLALPFQIGMFGTYAKLVDRYVKHERLRAVLYQYATYSGASPWKAPATLAVIPHAEMHFGGWYIEGGLYRLAEELQKLAEENGAEIRTSTPVEQICAKGNVVTGIRLENGEEINVDAVIANSDVLYTYRNLIDSHDRPKWPDKRLDALDPGGSGMVLLLGVRGKFPQLAHHTKFMPDDYAGANGDLRRMAEGGRLPSEPCIYVCSSDVTDATCAPFGDTNLFVLASSPPRWRRGRAIDWDVEGPRYRDRVIGLLEHRFGLENLSQRIVAEAHWTPRDLEATYNAHAGSIYGVGSNSRLQAFLRPPNRDKSLRGLYFAGGATHPGGGLPLVALSGKIASEMVLATHGPAGG